MDDDTLDFFGPRSVAALELWENYSALQRAGFTDEQALELVKVMLATALHINAAQE